MNPNKFCIKCKNAVHCCTFKDKKGFTFLTLKDANKIKRKTKLDFEYFLDFSPLKKEIITSLKNDDPALEGYLRFMQLTKDGRLLRLKTKYDKNDKTFARCVFLDENGKCKIYDIRPNICRIYPFWVMKLQNGKLKIIEHDLDSKCKYLQHSLKSMTEKEINEIRSIFKKIQSEIKDYSVNIKKLQKKN